MNVTFRLPSDELTNQFVSEAKKRDLQELKGQLADLQGRIKSLQDLSFQLADPPRPS